MKTIAKLVLGAGALAAGYFLTKKDVEVGSDGIQRFTSEAKKKAVNVLSHSEGADTPAAAPVGMGGRFSLGVNPHGDGSGPSLTKFINGVVADGSKVLVTKNILDDHAVQNLQAVIVATSTQDAFDLGHDGSEFVMLA